MLKDHKRLICLTVTAATALGGCVAVDNVETELRGAKPQRQVAVKAAQAATANPGTLAIITTNVLNDGSKMMGAYVAYKRQTRQTIVVTENKTYLSNGVVESSGWGNGVPPTTPVTLQETDVRAEAIYDWLRANYVSLNIKDVLLIGNPDPTGGDVPMKGMLWRKNIENIDTNAEPVDGDVIGSLCLDDPKPATYVDCMNWRDQHDLARVTPTDYYYANMLHNWVKDAEGDVVDITTVDFLNHELNVGRLPIQNSDTASLDKILAKLIRYTAEKETGWRKNALLGMDTHNPDPYYVAASWVPYGEAIRNDILVPHGFNSYRVYANFTPQECIDAATDLADFTPYLDACLSYAVPMGDVQTQAADPSDGLIAMGSVWAGKYWPGCVGPVCKEQEHNFGLVAWGAHGGNSLASDILDIGPADDYTEYLDDTHPAFVASMSCSNAMPDTDPEDHAWNMVDDNVGAALLRKGAIGFLGATRTSGPMYYKSYQQDPLYQENVGNADINYGFIHELIDENRTAGEALSEVRKHLSDSVLKQTDVPIKRYMANELMKFNFYGDPTVGMENVTSPDVIELPLDTPTYVPLAGGATRVLFANLPEDGSICDLMISLDALSGLPIPGGTVWINGTRYDIGGDNHQAIQYSEPGPYTIEVTTESDFKLQVTAWRANCKKMCTSADVCDDGIACTIDTCSANAGVCEHTPQDNVYEAETMYHSTGNAYADGWNIYSNGYVSFTHTFNGGTQGMTVRAAGAPANWVWPNMRVDVDGTAVYSTTVGSATWNEYTFSFAAPTGTHEVRIYFTNDYYGGPSNDRNLYVDKATVACASSGPSTSVNLGPLNSETLFTVDGSQELVIDQLVFPGWTPTKIVVGIADTGGQALTGIVVRVNDGDPIALWDYWQQIDIPFYGQQEIRLTVYSATSRSLRTQWWATN